MNAIFPLAVVGAFAVACADGTLPARTARDPSNPSAPETPPPATEVSPAARPTAESDEGVPSPPAAAVRKDRAPASASSGASP